MRDCLPPLESTNSKNRCFKKIYSIEFIKVIHKKNFVSYKSFILYIATKLIKMILIFPKNIKNNNNTSLTIKNKTDILKQNKEHLPCEATVACVFVPFFGFSRFVVGGEACKLLSSKLTRENK